MKKFLGLEFGSTRIKAVLIDEKHATVSSGDYTWNSRALRRRLDLPAGGGVEGPERGDQRRAGP